VRRQYNAIALPTIIGANLAITGRNSIIIGIGKMSEYPTEARKYCVFHRKKILVVLNLDNLRFSA
jgi:hypothetical protein